MSNPGVFPKSSGNKIFAQDIENLRRVPPFTTSTYVLSPIQTGGLVLVSGAVTVPPTAGQFQVGDVCTVHNAAGTSVSIVMPVGPGINVTCQIAGTTITPTIMSANSLVTFLCVNVSPLKFLVIGAGVS